MNAWRPHPDLVLGSERIAAEDSARQARTAVDIIERLADQPGVILADEVGMGKTFVAMAVAAGVLESTGRRRPVVVMVPPAVADKWPSDWRVFRELCLPPASPLRATDHPIRHGSEFLKLLDDPPERRTHVIFMTHGALRATLKDPFIELAVIRQAFSYQRGELARRRETFPKWAAQILNDRWFTEERTRRLLAAPPTRWWGMCEDRPSLTDDPVPELFAEAIQGTDLSGVREALLQLPLRRSANERQRVQSVRHQLRAALHDVWRAAIGGLDFRLPLLILDEAHHVKNPNQLASLFSDGADTDGLEGALAGKFERMLFLTATPFQLGHHELIRVISRFSAVRLSRHERDRFTEQQDDLRASLDRSQADAARLDAAWGRLCAEDVSGLSEGWWSTPTADLPEPVRLAAAAAQRATESFASAQHALRPWVVRHCRPRRREVVAGAGILPEHDGETIGDGEGLGVDGDAALPFLLAARAESLVSLMSLRQHSATRAIFAEGLASSYDAFRHRAKDDADPADDEDLPVEFQWYLDQIEQFIPRGNPALLDSHPKIRATTQRVLNLWSQGEKALVFCHYRATGRALRRAISAALDIEITRLARSQGTTIEELQRRSANQLDTDSPAARFVREQVGLIGERHELVDADRLSLGETVLRFLRTPAFQVRFLDLSAPMVDGLRTSFDSADPAGLVDRIEAFCRRAAMLVEYERAELWDDLGNIQTGDIRYIEADEASGTRSAEMTLPNVRLANGETAGATRRRLMRTFNSPFFPEVLIASAVMSEGVDLHWDCRHVIHHDLDWNPSVLEQRTGRVDRVGSKAEQLAAPILVYEPFLAGTQDERLYRVVKDRERWFDVVMGGSPPSSQWELDRMAERVALPDDLLGRLTFELSTNDTARPEPHGALPIASQPGPSADAREERA